MASQQVLWYFADPMCSWCWGFAPVIESLHGRYRERLPLALVMGGLRPGTTQPITPEFREETLAHWRDVQARTGQAFDFEAALPEGFVYDTEPSSRAVVAVEELKPEVKFAYFKAVQAAFYRQGRDVTRPDTLAALAQEQGIEPGPFLDAFESEDIRRRTEMHFRQTHEAGISGFPTVVLQRDTDFTLLTYGYAALEELAPRVEAWIEGA